MYDAITLHLVHLCCRADGQPIRMGEVHLLHTYSLMYDAITLHLVNLCCRADGQPIRMGEVRLLHILHLITDKLCDYLLKQKDCSDCQGTE